LYHTWFCKSSSLSFYRYNINKTMCFVTHASSKRYCWKVIRLVRTQWVRHLATSLLKSSNDKYMSASYIIATWSSVIFSTVQGSRCCAWNAKTVLANFFVHVLSIFGQFDYEHETRLLKSENRFHAQHLLPCTVEKIRYNE
jgi:hypothetical protein